MSKKLPSVHPGEVLREAFMQPLGLSSSALAKALGVTPARINEIVREKRGISADTANSRRRLVMRSLFCFALLLLVGCASTGTKKVQFQVEALNKVTFARTIPFSRGDVLKLHFSNLVSNDVFMINRCGEYCNTSKLVFIVDGRQKPPAGQTVRFTEDGDYYFWVQRQLEDGEAGPSVIEKLVSSERGFFVKFRSGTTVSGDLISADLQQNRAPNH